MRRAAHARGREAEIAPIAAADAIDQAQARVWMHDVVVVGDDVEQCAANLLKVNLAPADLELAARKQITLENIAPHFPKNPPRHRHVAAHPALEQIELLGIAVTLGVAV